MIVNYIAPIEEVERLMPDHFAYLADHFADGTFLVSGRQKPRTGGFIVAAGDDRAAVERLIATDPFVTGGVATYTVLEIEPTRAAPAWRPVLRAAGVELPG
nr:YciI family protein [Planosporangium thailandense]